MGNIVEFKGVYNEQIDERMNRLVEDYMIIVHDACVARYGTDELSDEQIADVTFDCSTLFAKKLYHI